MNANKILIALLFLIAFVLLTVAMLYPVFIDEYEMPIEETPAPVIQEPEVEETVIWTTSRKHLTLEAPADWEAQQFDAGGKSVIRVADEYGLGVEHTPETELVIELGLSSSFEGQPITLDAWMNEQLLDADKIEPCESVDFGNEVGQCYLVTVRSETHREYFGTADSLTYFKVIIGLDADSGVSRVFSSINFNPTTEELASARIIP